MLASYRLYAWWGLNEDVIAYADRLAEAGFAVIALDMFRSDCDGTEHAERLERRDAGGHGRRRGRHRPLAGRAWSCA